MNYTSSQNRQFTGLEVGLNNLHCYDAVFSINIGKGKVITYIGNVTTYT